MKIVSLRNTFYKVLIDCVAILLRRFKGSMRKDLIARVISAVNVDFPRAARHRYAFEI